MGAVRLKIIDLEHGDQPMSSDDGDTVLVFNGEIYNHAEVRRELEKAGHKFRTHCDTEVVLRAFLEWDVAGFERLRGMFAAALWTESQRRLVLVRDRMGIKPLYYLRARRRDLYFGSELKAILLHPEIERRHRVRRGSTAIFRSIMCRGRTRWSRESKNCSRAIGSNGATARFGAKRTGGSISGRIRGMDLESAKGELDRLLRSAVREHLVSDVPLGVWSSGGLDSSTILHYAAQQSRGAAQDVFGFLSRAQL